MLNTVFQGNFRHGSAIAPQQVPPDLIKAGGLYESIRAAVERCPEGVLKLPAADIDDVAELVN